MIVLITKNKVVFLHNSISFVQDVTSNSERAINAMINFTIILSTQVHIYWMDSPHV
jgi:hypothetical protein